MGRESELFQAAKSGDTSIIRRLLGASLKGKTGRVGFRKTVNPNCQDDDGSTPLHHAALNGHKEAVSLMLRYNVSTHIPDNKGNFPLHLAAWNGHNDVCEVLIHQGPSKANVDEVNSLEETALLLASQYGHVAVVRTLLEAGADSDIRNLKNESPFDMAALFGRLDVVKVLGKANSKPVFTTWPTHSALHYAARHGHLAVVSYLLEIGADVNLMTDFGTALHEAALYGRLDVVRNLIEAGVDICATDARKLSALDIVDKHQSSRVSKEIRVLLEARQTQRSEERRFEFEATMSYKPTLHDEGALHFEKGDRIIVTKKRDSGTWYGTCNGKEGHFPSTFVEPIQEEDAVVAGDVLGRSVSMSASDFLQLEDDYQRRWSLSGSSGNEGGRRHSSVPKKPPGIPSQKSRPAYENVQLESPQKASQTTVTTNNVEEVTEPVYTLAGQETGGKEEITHHSPHMAGTSLKEKRKSSKASRHKASVTQSSANHETAAYGPAEPMYAQPNVDRAVLPSQNHPGDNEYCLSAGVVKSSDAAKNLKHFSYRNPQTGCEEVAYSVVGNLTKEGSLDGANSMGSASSSLSAYTLATVHHADLTAEDNYATPTENKPILVSTTSLQRHTPSAEVHSSTLADGCHKRPRNDTEMQHLDSSVGADASEHSRKQPRPLPPRDQTNGSYKLHQPKTKDICASSTSQTNEKTAEATDGQHWHLLQWSVESDDAEHRVDGLKSQADALIDAMLLDLDIIQATPSVVQDEEISSDANVTRPSTAAQPVVAAVPWTTVSKSEWLTEEGDMQTSHRISDTIEQESTATFSTSEKQQSAPSSAGMQQLSPPEKCLSLESSRKQGSQTGELKNDVLTQGESSSAPSTLLGKRLPPRWTPPPPPPASSLPERLKKLHLWRSESHQEVTSSPVDSCTSSTSTLEKLNGKKEDIGDVEIEDIVDRTNVGVDSEDVLERVNGSVMLPEVDEQDVSDEDGFNDEYDDDEADVDENEDCKDVCDESGKSHSPESPGEGALVKDTSTVISSEEMSQQSVTSTKVMSPQSIASPEIMSAQQMASPEMIPQQALASGRMMSPDMMGLTERTPPSSPTSPEMAQPHVLKEPTTRPRSVTSPEMVSDQTKPMKAFPDLQRTRSVTSPDGTDDWAAIADMFGSLTEDLGPLPTPGKELTTPAVTVETWLRQVHLQDLRDQLTENGYDHLHFMSGDFLKSNDLEEIGIGGEDASTLLAAASLLPDRPAVLKPQTVSEWLEQLSLDQYESLIIEDDQTLEDVLKWTEDEWKAAGVTKKGHLQRLLVSAQSLYDDVEARLFAHRLSVHPNMTLSRMMELSKDSSLPRIPEVEFKQDYRHIQTQYKKLSTASTDSEKDLERRESARRKFEQKKPAKEVINVGALGRCSLERNNDFNSLEKDVVNSKELDRSAVGEEVNVDVVDSNVSKHRASSDLSDLGNVTVLSAPLIRSDSDIVPLRPPQHAQRCNEKLLKAMGITGKHLKTTASDWKYNISALTRSTVDYYVKYLGSMPVKDFDGPNTTQQACQKMRISTANMQKMPTITLSISAQALNLIDSQSQLSVQEHHIESVLYIAQDLDEKSVFGYVVSEDAGQSLSFCHVFRANSEERAEEVVLTLGQAFEIAYQKLKKKMAAAEEAAAIFEENLEQRRQEKKKHAPQKPRRRHATMESKAREDFKSEKLDESVLSASSPSPSHL